MTQDERSRIKKYFKKFPTWAVVVIAILGLPSLLVGLSSPSSSFGGFSLFWGGLWTALGVWRIVSYYNKPSDAEMDAWIQDDLKDLKARALDKTGLDPSELVAECVKRDWQVEVYDDAKRLRELVTPLVDGGAKVVLDHFGKPDAQQGINDPGFQYLLGMAASQRVWVKLSAPYRSSLEIAAAAAPLLRRTFGSERLLWGSDWPFTGFEKTTQYSAMRAALNTWIPDPAERDIILADTPAKLFRF